MAAWCTDVLVLDSVLSASPGTPGVACNLELRAVPIFALLDAICWHLSLQSRCSDASDDLFMHVQRRGAAACGSSEMCCASNARMLC